jgi:site-specific recombinase XerD
VRQVAGSLLLSEAIREFIIDRRLRNLSPQTIEWYEKRLGIVKRELKDPHLCDISTSVIRSMVGRMLDREQSAGTINGNLQALKALLNWAFEEELEVGVDPRRVKLIKQPKKVPQILSIEQVDRMIRSIKTNTVWGCRDRMIVLTFLDTGCRLSELRSMDVGDLDLPLVRVHGKGDKERVLSLSLPAQKEMLRWLRIRKKIADPDTGPLFPSRNYPHRLGRSWVGVRVRRLGQDAGIPFTVTPHVFRRTFASHFLRQQGALVHLQQILGHTDVTMSRRYAAVFDEDAHESAMQLSILKDLRLGRK